MNLKNNHFSLLYKRGDGIQFLQNRYLILSIPKISKIPKYMIPLSYKGINPEVRYNSIKMIILFYSDRIFK